MKFQWQIMTYSEKVINFASSSIQERAHRGELISFCPSENLENSSEKAKRLKAAPPVYSYISLHPHYKASANIYGCELKFHSFFMGFPEPSDGECQEGSPFLCL